MRDFGVFLLLAGGACAVLAGVVLVWPPLALVAGGVLAMRLAGQVIREG